MPCGILSMLLTLEALFIVDVQDRRWCSGCRVTIAIGVSPTGHKFVIGHCGGVTAAPHSQRVDYHNSEHRSYNLGF
jgi:hypothetical protein